MSRVRVHNFSVSLDGFGTGERQSPEAPFGHAGTRLHQWFFPTRTFRAMQGQPGGSTGIDDAFAGARLLAEGKLESRYHLVGGHGGAWIYNVESNEELDRLLAQAPVYNMASYEVYALAEMTAPLVTDETPAG